MKMSDSNKVKQVNAGAANINNNNNNSHDSKEDTFSTKPSAASQVAINKDLKIIDELIGSVEKISLSDELQCQLDALQCPFTWKMKNMLIHKSPINVITRLEEKEEELDGEEGAFLLLRQFGLQLALCFENWYEGDITAARERQRICDSLIENETAPYVDGLKHISKSCAAHLAHMSGTVLDTRALLKTIVPFKELDDVNKACVVGMRGIVLMEYGYEGTSQSVPYIEQALELDPSSAEWHFLLGKSLRRLRRLNAFNEIPDKRELKALEKAVEMSQCSGYCTFLAQTYRETAFRVFSLNKNNLSPFKEALDSMNEKAAEYYRKSIQMAPDSSHINIRCALGFLNLPFPYRDVKMAKSCIDKALILAPNNTMAHHVEGKYFERIGDLEAAKRSYKTSGKYGAFGAYMDYLRLEFKTNPKYDPSPLFKEMLEMFIEEPYRVGILSQIGCYYYLMQNNLKEAVTYWLRIIDENYDTARLKTYKPVCVFIKKPFDLLQVAVDEVRLALSKGNISSEERGLYQRLILKFEGTELLANPPEPHRQEILEESASVLKEEEERSSNSRGRERGGKRGRGNYQDYRGGRGRGRGTHERGRGTHERGRGTHERGRGTHERGRGTNERGTGRGRGYYHNSNRRDSSSESNSSSKRYQSKERYAHTRSFNRDSSCESNNSCKDWRTIRNRRASEDEYKGPNYELSSSPRDSTTQKEFGRKDSYRRSYDRDSSCDSTGSHGSIHGRDGSRRQFQDHDGDYDRMRGSSKSIQRDTKCSWRASEDEYRGQKNKLSSSPRDNTTQKESGRKDSYRHSYDRDSSCDSSGSHGSIHGRGGSRKQFQDRDGDHDRMRGPSKGFQRDTKCNWRGSEDEYRGPNSELSKSPRDNTTQKESGRKDSYRRSYDRDSSCDSAGSHGSIQGRGASRSQFQDRDGDYDRLHGSSKGFQRDTKCNWREGAAVRDPSHERQERQHNYSSTNWRERPSNNQEGGDRGSYRGSSQGNGQSYRNHSYNRNRDSSADSYKSDKLGEQDKKEYFHKYTQDAGSRYVKQENSSFNRRFKLAQADKQLESRDSLSQYSKGSANVHTGRNDDELEQKLRARKEMSMRISDHKVNKN